MLFYYREKHQTTAAISVTPPELWFFEEIVAHSPGVSPLESKQFCTGDVEDLPPVVPHSGLLLAIRLSQMWPNCFLVSNHFGEPVLRRLVMGEAGESTTDLAGSGVVLARNPPLGLQLQILLEEME